VTVLEARPVAVLEPGMTREHPDLSRTRIALLRTRDPLEVEQLCHDWPQLRVLAVLPADCPSDTVVAVLEAGADGCLRGAQPAEVNAHLSAMVRRLAS
jgi:hypothetical protein